MLTRDHLTGGHKVCRAAEGRGGLVLEAILGEAKVPDADVAVEIEENVVELHVAIPAYRGGRNAQLISGNTLGRETSGR